MKKWRLPCNAELLLLTALCAGAFALPSLATAQEYLKISAGTGFFINKNGHMVTNAHVVRGCQSINILTPQGERPAELVGRDDTHDLAVLRVLMSGSMESAPLRWNIKDLKIGDGVNVIGFPGQQGISGRHTYKKTTVSSLEGPTGEPVWIQLGSVAKQGNSGGPVLDDAGNVIAVVSGVAQKYAVDKSGAVIGAPIGQSDVAITLSTLRDFLREQGVSYYEAPSGMVSYGSSTIERNALNFVFPVRCVQGTISQ